MSRRLPVLAALLLVAVSTAPAIAQDSAGVSSGSPYLLSMYREAALVALSAAGTAIPVAFKNDLITPSCPCQSADVNGFDRGSIRTIRSGASKVSDVLGSAALLAPFALDALDAQGNGGLREGGFYQDALVLTEALLVNQALNEIVKGITSRPRPYAYAASPSDPLLQSAETYTSFYSAHTSATFAAGIAYARTYQFRHPGSPATKWIYAGAVAMGTSVAVLRVAAGKHFPSDVIAGAVAGSLAGWFVPTLHRRGGDLGATLIPLPGGAELGFRLGFR